MTPLDARRYLYGPDAKAAKKALKAARPPRVIQNRAEPVAPNQRDPRQRDAAFLAWLHEGLPCIACLIENPGWHDERFPIEAAHQNLAIASKGWRERGLGKRIHDLGRTVPLCAWHHRLAPNACDCGQRQFWDRLGLGDTVADFAADLARAFTDNKPGVLVIQLHASAARMNTR